MRQDWLWPSPVTGITNEIKHFNLWKAQFGYDGLVRQRYVCTWSPDNNFLPPVKQFRANFLDDCRKWGQVLGWSTIGSGLLQLQSARSASIHLCNLFVCPYLRFPEIVFFKNRGTQFQTDPNLEMRIQTKEWSHDLQTYWTIFFYQTHGTHNGHWMHTEKCIRKTQHSLLGEKLVAMLLHALEFSGWCSIYNRTHLPLVPIIIADHRIVIISGSVQALISGLARLLSFLGN